MTFKDTIKRPFRRFAVKYLDMQEIPPDPSIAVCHTCRTVVTAWRIYAGGRVECLKCGSRPQ